jgi:hypothetical protein
VEAAIVVALFDRIVKTHRGIRPQIAQTALERSWALSRELDCDVWLKADHLMPTGSFKVRSGDIRSGRSALGGAHISPTSTMATESSDRGSLPAVKIPSESRDITLTWPRNWVRADTSRSVNPSASSASAVARGTSTS